MTYKSPSAPPEPETLRRVEAVLFVAGDKGCTVSELAAAADRPPSAVKAALETLADTQGQGVEVVELAGRWYMAAPPDLGDVIDRYRTGDASSQIRLSKAALETLAVVAYGQPVTRGDVEEIRGVRSDRALETLLGHGLVRIAGRRKAPGSPLLYRTSDQFLKVFGLSAVSDLPTVAEIEAIKRGITASGEEEQEHDGSAE